jgi:hypothetical protein
MFLRRAEKSLNETADSLYGIRGWLALVVTNHLITCAQLAWDLAKRFGPLAKAMLALAQDQRGPEIILPAGFLILLPAIFLAVVAFVAIITAIKLLTLQPSAPSSLRNFNYLFLALLAFETGWRLFLGKEISGNLWALAGNAAIAAAVIAYTYRSLRVHNTYDLPMGPTARPSPTT